MSDMERYVVLNKNVGETPLSCAEAFRATRPDLSQTPLSYAGRLDPMASGKLLVLIGEECKQQSNYHDLDKEYEFSVLFGIASDTHDVLGRLQTSPDGIFAEGGVGVVGEANIPSGDRADGIPRVTNTLQETLSAVALSLKGSLTTPYPLFSAKTVQGKPLHMWTLEGRLNEIEIPTRTSTIYELELIDLSTVSRHEVAERALAKIETIPPVTDERKALGNDFRRVEVRQDWNDIYINDTLPDSYPIATFRCVASSGSYMRTLATLIAEKLSTTGIAWHIHRTKIGIFDADSHTWSREF